MNEEVSHIIEYAQKVLELKVPYEETEGTSFHRYNDIERYPNANAKAKIKYVANLNENDGVIRVVYSQKISKDGRNLHGCEDIEAVWILEKVDGYWKVVSIKEDP